MSEAAELPEGWRVYRHENNGLWYWRDGFGFVYGTTCGPFKTRAAAMESAQARADEAEV